jgi:hypothetical protein
MSNLTTKEYHGFEGNEFWFAREPTTLGYMATQKIKRAKKHLCWVHYYGPSLRTRRVKQSRPGTLDCFVPRNDGGNGLLRTSQ